MSKVSLGESFVRAIKGLFWAVSRDRNTVIHIAIGFSTIIAAFLLGITRIELMIIAIMSFLVISLELFNNSIEKLIDAINPFYNKKLGQIKDLMAGIVLVVDFLAVIIGVLIFYKPFILAFNIKQEIPVFFLFATNFLLVFISIILAVRRRAINKN